MANKKITELLLIDEATDDVNFAGDDGVQTFRVTAAQLKEYIAAAIEDRLDAIEADNWITTPRVLNNAINQDKISPERDHYQANGNASFNFSNSSSTRMRFNVPLRSSGITANGTSDIFTVSKAGWYDISWSFLANDGNFNNSFRWVSTATVKNSANSTTLRLRGDRYYGVGANQYPIMQGSGKAFIEAGGTVQIDVEHNYTSDWASNTAGGTFNLLSIVRS